jgi:hypothetical protein
MALVLVREDGTQIKATLDILKCAEVFDADSSEASLAFRSGTGGRFDLWTHRGQLRFLLVSGLLQSIDSDVTISLGELCL